MSYHQISRTQSTRTGAQHLSLSPSHHFVSLRTVLMNIREEELVATLYCTLCINVIKLTLCIRSYVFSYLAIYVELSLPCTTTLQVSCSPGPPVNFHRGLSLIAHSTELACHLVATDLQTLNAHLQLSIHLIFQLW